MYKVYFLIKYIRKPILSNEIGYFYGFKPVFLVEKNKKRVWDKKFSATKKARDFQLRNSSFLILSCSLIVFYEVIGHEN